jgi:alanine racemase
MSIQQSEKIGLRTWLEIDRAALKSNIDMFKALIGPNVKLMGVVKSNAYGHGLVDTATHISEFGADWIGVDSIVEGVRLRKDGITKPILILGFTLPEMLETAVASDISLSISHFEALEAIKNSTFSKKVKVHIKVDTGMHRQGFLIADVDRVLRSLKSLADKIEVEGLFTHFASAKNPSFPDYTKMQIKDFEIWRAAFRNAGYTPITHASATAGTILFPEAHYDMVRIGIGLYGLWPSTETKAFAEGRIKLTPILTWKTLVSEVKQLPMGSKISYDGTETLYRDSVVGVCPIGYWHGFPRNLSAIGHVLAGGVRAKVLGRVTMDMIMVDLTDCGTVSVGDEAVIIGKQGSASTTTEDMARLSDASWYEIVTRINPLIKKIFF